MINAVKHLQEIHKNISEAIEVKRKRISQMEESLGDTKLSLLDLIEEANAVQQAIEVLNKEDDSPTDKGYI